MTGADLDFFVVGVAMVVPAGIDEKFTFILTFMHSGDSFVNMSYILYIKTTFNQVLFASNTFFSICI